MLRGSSLLFLLLALISASALGQDASSICDINDASPPNRHLNIADPGDPDALALLGRGFADLPHGQPWFEQARSIAEKNSDLCGRGLAEFGEASSLDRSQNAEIQEHLQAAAQLLGAARATHALARVHYFEALMLQRAAKNEDGRRVALQAAEEYDASGDGRNALQARISAFHIAHSFPDPAQFASLLQQARSLHEASAEAALLHTWGDREYAAGRLASALQQYQAARHVFEGCACDDAALATLLVSMGRLERIQGQPQLALKDYALALKLQKRTDSKDPYILQTMNAMAVAYDAMGRVHEALVTYQHALAEAERMQATEFIPFLKGNMGGQYLKSKEYAPAARLLKDAIASTSSNYLLCFRYAQLSEAQLALAEPKDALASASQALPLCRKAGDKDPLVDALEEHAKAAEAQQQYDTALADVSEAMALREEIRSHLVPDDARKRGYNERIQGLYDTSIDLLTRMGRSREALETAEKGRARAFLDLMGTQQLPAGTIQNLVAVDAPSYASYVSAAPANTAQIVEVAQHYHSTVLAYWASEKALYIWVVTAKDEVVEKRVAVTRKTLAALVASLSAPVSPTQAVATQVSEARAADLKARGGQLADVRGASDACRKLYDLLIAPVERHLPRERGSLLTIIPHHELFRLAFAALTDAKGEYLVERFALHTVPAAALLRYTQENAEKAAALPPHYLLIANPSSATFGSGLVLPALPATVTEVHAIGRLLPAPEVTSLAGSAAREPAVLEALQAATVVHFATHAVLDDADPQRSMLLLYPATIGGEPVRLTTADIYRLKLHTQMVVLSACRTGLGRITGDGIEGFSRAFFYAGTASFVATLWDVADEPTSALLPRFYRELQKGNSRSRALRVAQIELIQDLRRGKIQAQTALGPISLPEKPIYWAAFSLAGEP